MQKKQNGFSLLEVLVAMMLLATALLYIFSVFPISLRSTFHGMNAMIASEVGQAEMEYLKNLPWEQLKNGTSQVNIKTHEINVESNGIKSSYKFSTVPGVQTLSGQPDLKIIRLDVKRADGNTNKIWASFETIVYKVE
jgi:prepilin-type N-terminal cleavage/methylation domain-containing protein